MCRILIGAALLIMTVVLVGCETVKGVGRDITGSSDAVEQALIRKR